VARNATGATAHGAFRPRKCPTNADSSGKPAVRGVKLTYERLANGVKLEQLVIGPFSDE
jgi:hypothetical protein